MSVPYGANISTALEFVVLFASCLRVFFLKSNQAQALKPVHRIDYHENFDGCSN